MFLSPVQLAEKLALLLALAFFLGLAFEEIYKREDRAAPGGVRTFPLLALSGAMLYLVEPRNALAFVAGLLVLGIWLHACLRALDRSSGPATSLVLPASNLLAYVLGPIALTETPWLALGATIAAVLLLSGREQMHRLVLVVPQDEIMTAGKFLVLAAVVLPIVPDAPILSLTPVTPYHVWLALVAVCAISYLSYLLQRYSSLKQGSLLPAILGGIYSSTATTVALARRLKESGAGRADLAAGIVAATAVMYVRLLVVIALFNSGLALALAPAFAALAAIAAAAAFLELKRFLDGKSAERPLAAPNPLELPMALLFAGAFFVVSVASAWVQANFGQAGVFSLGFIVGIVDIDPFILNVAQGNVPGMGAASVAATILIAASANNLAKAAYTISFGGLAAGRRPMAVLVILAAAGFAAAGYYLLRG